MGIIGSAPVLVLSSEVEVGSWDGRWDLRRAARWERFVEVKWV